MEVVEAAFWEFWSAQAVRARFPFPRLRRTSDASDLSELLSGYWLAQSGHRIERAEILGERVQSPRRRDRAKTCDFGVSPAGGAGTEQFVEVKCTAAEPTTALPDLAHQAARKGARWLILAALPIRLPLAGQITADTLDPDRQRTLFGQRSYLKLRRAGLVHITLLTFHPAST